MKEFPTALCLLFKGPRSSARIRSSNNSNISGPFIPRILQMKPVQVACIALMFVAMTIAAPAPTIVVGTGAAVTTLALPTYVGGTGGNATVATTAALLGAKKLLLAGALLAAQA